MTLETTADGRTCEQTEESTLEYVRARAMSLTLIGGNWGYYVKRVEADRYYVSFSCADDDVY